MTNCNKLFIFIPEVNYKLLLNIAMIKLLTYPGNSQVSCVLIT